MRRTLSTLLLVGALAVSAIAPATARPENAGPPERTTILDAAVGNENFEILEDVVLALAANGYDLTGLLDGRRQLTVFAPTDAAFVNLLGALNANSLGDVVAALEGVNGNSGWANLAAVVAYHVAPGERFSGDVLSSDTIPTLQGEKIVVDGTTVSGAQIAIDAGLFDVDVDNGVIHGIQAVMLPPSIAAAL